VSPRRTLNKLFCLYNAIVYKFSLTQNYPNPITSISWVIPGDDFFTVKFTMC